MLQILKGYVCDGCGRREIRGEFDPVPDGWIMADAEAPIETLSDDDMAQTHMLCGECAARSWKVDAAGVLLFADGNPKAAQ